MSPHGGRSPGVTPNLRHLVLFDQVVRRGSVSAAARANNLSQPAVTQAVAHIEAALGARLMQRSHAGRTLRGGARGRRAARPAPVMPPKRCWRCGARPRWLPGDAPRGVTSTRCRHSSPWSRRAPPGAARNARRGAPCRAPAGAPVGTDGSRRRASGARPGRRRRSPGNASAPAEIAPSPGRGCGGPRHRQRCHGSGHAPCAACWPARSSSSPPMTRARDR
jgi:hypothetical protein